MTERDAQIAIWRMLASRVTIVAPNYTPRGWFESDIFAVTKDGYGVEYEIKRTIYDFKSDAKKGVTEYAGWNREQHKLERKTRYKLAQLANGDSRGPSRFFYVVPIAIFEAVQSIVPPWAGLIVVQHMDRVGHYAKVKKVAPRLHNVKVPADVTQHMASVFYYRFWRMLERWSVATGSNGTE